jgi:hypothetical protein
LGHNAAWKRRPGRPSKYDSGYIASFPVLAHELALLGLKDEEMCRVFGVSIQTFHNWKEAHSEFVEALKTGKDPADGKVVASLFHRATGYSHEDVDIRVIDGEIVQTPLIKHYPPDSTAMIFWLKNRQRALWRDKIETGVTDTEGKDVPIDLSDAARRIAFMFAAARKE